MSDDPASGRLDYRSGADTAADDAPPPHRSLRAWLLLLGAWVAGLGVWVVYLAALGYFTLRLLS